MAAKISYEKHGTPISDKQSGYPIGTGRVEIWRSSEQKIPKCSSQCKKCATLEHQEVIFV